MDVTTFEKGRGSLIEDIWWHEGKRGLANGDVTTFLDEANNLQQSLLLQHSFALAQDFILFCYRILNNVRLKLHELGF